MHYGSAVANLVDYPDPREAVCLYTSSTRERR